MSHFKTPPAEKTHFETCDRPLRKCSRCRRYRQALRDHERDHGRDLPTEEVSA